MAGSILRVWNSLGRLDAAIRGDEVPATGSDGVLMFHSVGDGAFDNLSPDTFRERIERFNRTVTFADLPEIYENPSEDRRIVLTFDDGYRGFYEHVVPILHEFDIPATVFVVARTLEDQSFVVNEGIGDGYMTPEQLAELANDDLVTIGNHTMTHPDLHELSSPEQLRTEIVAARCLIEEELDTTVDRFCYPGNRSTPVATSIVNDSHNYAVSGGGWKATVSPRTNPYLIPRVNGASERWRVRWHLLDESTHLARSIDEFRAVFE